MITLLLLAAILIISFLIHRRNMKLLRTVTSPDRGTRSERRMVIKLLRKGIAPEAIYHDLYLPKRNGGYSQIDLIVVMPQGLVAIEMKDYSGWLFGSENQQYWTQILNYGKEKYRFYNPILQNQGHIRTLREQSEQMAQLPIFNIVLFDGNCQLKKINYTSSGSYVGYSNHIIKLLNQISTLTPATYTDKNEISQILTKGVHNGNNPEIVSSHIARVQQMNHSPAPTIKPSLIKRWRLPF